jgi:hypothetical protein
MECREQQITRHFPTYVEFLAPPQRPSTEKTAIRSPSHRTIRSQLPEVLPPPPVCHVRWRYSFVASLRRSSIVEFMDLCQGQTFCLTRSNVLEIDPLERQDALETSKSCDKRRPMDLRHPRRRHVLMNPDLNSSGPRGSHKSILTRPADNLSARRARQRAWQELPPQIRGRYETAKPAKTRRPRNGRGERSGAGESRAWHRRRLGTRESAFRARARMSRLSTAFSVNLSFPQAATKRMTSVTRVQEISFKL